MLIVGHAVATRRVDVVALGHPGERLLDLARHEQLDVVRFHAGHEGGDHRLAHGDGRVFLAGEVLQAHHREDDERKDDDGHQGLVAEREGGEVHCSRVSFPISARRTVCRHAGRRRRQSR